MAHLSLEFRVKQGKEITRGGLLRTPFREKTEGVCPGNFIKKFLLRSERASSPARSISENLRDSERWKAAFLQCSS